MISIENVSMKFNLGNEKVSSLKEYFIKIVRKELKYTEFWALKDVDIKIDKGDVVGIIGKNGAGKSTLLKIVSGVLKPTTGRITLEGNVAPLLELGAGFDYEMTGKENVFLNGALLGYTEDFIRLKYEEIVEFSELGDFINVPLRNYSSGMIMRLAFSIATVITSEILILDEILAVGDESFQKKCNIKMHSLIKSGATVIIVSHSVQNIRNLCNKALWLENGKVKMFGDAVDVTQSYEESF